VLDILKTKVYKLLLRAWGHLCLFRPQKYFEFPTLMWCSLFKQSERVNYRRDGSFIVLLSFLKVHWSSWRLFAMRKFIVWQNLPISLSLEGVRMLANFFHKPICQLKLSKIPNSICNRNEFPFLQKEAQYNINYAIKNL